MYINSFFPSASSEVNSRSSRSNMRDGSKWNFLKPSVQCFNSLCGVLAIIVIPVLILMLIVTFTTKYVDKVQIIYIDSTQFATHQTSQRFLSIALDSSVIAEGFKGFNMTNKKLIKMMLYLYPAFLRVGGSLADRLSFSPDSIEPDKNVEEFYREFPYGKFVDLNLAPNYTMTGVQWLKLMKLVQDTNLNIIFGLNALLRFHDGSWDYRNAESLIRFSNDHKLIVNWELGNEPNSFKHKFNKEVNATQMAKDFATLRHILKKYPRYNESLLVGPDITHPVEKHEESEIYLEQFLRNGIGAVDAITWHQYYVDGRTAEPNTFVSPEVFDLLKTQIEIVKNITKPLNPWNKSIWLGETASAYGGGAPNMSDTFIGSFIWVDKLGLSAKMGIRVVIRQAIFKGYYALLDDNYDPNPDWWISVLYKKLVGTRVVPYYTACSPKVRLYCHCTRRGFFSENPPSITVFGVNMNNVTAHVRIEALFPYEYEDEIYQETISTTVYAFELTAAHSLFSKAVLLNGKPLKLTRDNSLPRFVPKEMNSRPFVTMPPFSIVFWVVPSPFVRACYL